MDAPALPPALPPSQSTEVSIAQSTLQRTSQSTSQRVAPTLVSGINVAEDKSELGYAELDSDTQPTLISQSQPLAVGSLPMDRLPTAALSKIRALDFSFLTPRTAASPRPTGWLPSTQLTHSFGFMSRIVRSARLDSALRVPPFSGQFSSAIPVQWASANDWKRWAKAAEVQVTPMNANAGLVKNSGEDWSTAFVNQCQLSSQRQLTDASVYKLSLKDTTLGYVADRDQAYLLAQQLEQLLHAADFDPNKIAPQMSARMSGRMSGRSNGRSTGSSKATDFRITAGDRALLSINDSMADAVGYSEEWAAITWANNLRKALEAQPMAVGATQMALKGMAPSNITLKGEASWYGPYFHGRATANGETYNQHDLTVAHKSLPFGTYLKVRNLSNERTVVVRVNDRGPYVGDRSLDLSNAAAKCLGSDEAGVIPYEAVILNKSDSAQ